MSDHSVAHADNHAAGPGAGHGEHSDARYVKIWAVLLGLLVVSVAGPFVGIKIVTLITAFGIALVKAFLVAKNFMHLNVQRPYVLYLLFACLAIMTLLFGGVAADVMKHDGQNWKKNYVEPARHSALPAEPEHGEH